MGDSTPLLSDYNTESQAQTANKVVRSLDDTIESCIGGTGLFQLLRAILVAFAWVFDAQQTFINVFTDAQPAWHCSSPNDSFCSSAPNPCGLPDGSWAWDRPKYISVVSEWDLECSGPAVVGLPASAFFAGCLVGGLALGTLADSWLGRKKMLFLSCLTMSLTAALSVVTPNIWAYSAARFVCGFTRATVGTSALVLSAEMVDKRWRDRISIISFLCFTLGFLSLPAIAYLNRASSWRTLYLWTSIPSLCYSICAYFLIRESPRWLLVRGRREEAIEALKNIAASNRTVTMSSFSSLVVVEETSSANLFSAMKTLWEKTWAFQRLLAVMIVGFGIGMVYYGMPLGVGSLGPNLYISVTLNALSELPSSLITFFLIGKLNRRSSLLLFTVMSGLSSILCVFLKGKALGMAIEVASFFCACTAFDVLLIYSIELFPTCVRNSAVSMVRQALVFGGIWAPMLVVADRKGGFLSFEVFGFVIGCCGLFVAGLPETKGGRICDTMEEAENEERASNGL